MRLSKKQKSIVAILQAQGKLEKNVLFEALEGAPQDKKTHRSRYNSFSQTLKKLIEKGAVQWQGEWLTVASEATQEKAKKTQGVLETLQQLRTAQQSLTLANLHQWTDIREWLGSLAEWKLTFPAEEPRLVDLDAALEDSPQTIEPLLKGLGVDLEKVLASGLIFSGKHQQHLQQGVHAKLCEKIRTFSLPHKTLKSTIEAKLPHQSSQKTICQLIEPAVALAEEEKQEILQGFQEDYLQEAASRNLSLMFHAQIPFQPQLKLRFPGFFAGKWEWDRLYQQLVQKISNHAKAHGLYQTPEEWQLFLKQQARHRFEQAQRPKSSPLQAKAPIPPLYSCYQMLGLDETKNLEEIRMAFRKLVKVHHPDQGGNPEFFRSLNQAYTRLVASLENS